MNQQLFRKDDWIVLAIAAGAGWVWGAAANLVYFNMSEPGLLMVIFVAPFYAAFLLDWTFQLDSRGLAVPILVVLGGLLLGTFFGIVYIVVKRLRVYNRTKADEQA